MCSQGYYVYIYAASKKLLVIGSVAGEQDSGMGGAILELQLRLKSQYKRGKPSL